MPPLRYKDVRVSTIPPCIERRIARGLSINATIANDHSRAALNPPPFDELEAALAAKEAELHALLSPSIQQPKCSFGLPQIIFQYKRPLPTPRIVDSQVSFTEMKLEFMRYLSQNNITHLIPKSKLYQSMFLPYG